MKSITSPPTGPASPQVASRDRHAFPWSIVLLLGTLTAGAVVSAYYIARSDLEEIPPPATQQLPAATVRFSAQVQGVERAVVASASGQIQWMIAQPGEAVRRGQAIAQLDDAQLMAQLNTVQAQLATAVQQEHQVEAEREALRKDLWDAYLALYPEDRVVDEQVRNADREIVSVEAQLATARADLERARTAVANTSNPDYANSQFYQNQQRRLTQLEAQVRGLEQQLRLAQGSWVRALSSSLSPYISSPELDRLRNQWVEVLARLSDAKERAFQLRVQQHDLEAQRSALTVVSPVDGVVSHHFVEPGATVQPGQQLVSIAVRLDRVDLEGTGLQGAIDQLQAGQHVKVFLDLHPNHPLQGQVVAVNPLDLAQSQVANIGDRTQPATGIKLHIYNPNVFVMPGQSIEGTIVLNPNRQ
ncbi:HlyD family secretion protein [Egbenema bharatensis]|uniref:HlyD family secretion protein n=1 Tax=Egbenema bharatensis TaxID=3463334 RepID=UPI003A856A21